jgi:hypothetical protein
MGREAGGTSRSTSAYSGCSGGGGCSRLNSRSFSCCRSAYTLQQMHITHAYFQQIGS